MTYEHKDGGLVSVLEVSEESGRALVTLPDGRDHGVDVEHLLEIAGRQNWTHLREEAQQP